MKKKLTKREQGFVKDVASGISASQAVKNNFNIKANNSASAYAHKLKKKPKVVKRLLSIADSIPDKLLLEKHEGLLEQKELAYFVFARSIKDEEIEEHMEANGLDLIVIRPTDKGKMAFYSIPDANAIKAGLDMAYKLKSSYAPEKQETIIKVEKLEEIQNSLKTLSNGSPRE